MKRIPILFLVSIAVAPSTGRAQSPDAVSYVVRFPDPDKPRATVTATAPAAGRDAVEWMMPVWSPGFYRIEDYAGKVVELSATASDGTPLTVSKPKPNRWRVVCPGAAAVTVTYTLECKGRSVTTNWVGADYAVLNGPATFMTPMGLEKRPHEVSLVLPKAWTKSATGLPAVAGRDHSYRAPDYDTLADSPIAAGAITTHSFTVDGVTHTLAAFGDTAPWDATKPAADLEKLVRENRRQWGTLPFKQYVFLFACRNGGGGLEHLNSTLVTTNPASMKTPRGYASWLGLTSHEYVHAFNVKRLRPVELGPFDYEKGPTTASLWISEGLTSYYGDLVVVRAGLETPEAYLNRLSGPITQLQNAPGRLLQSLEQSSREVWTNSLSGVGANAKTVSYYVKGEVAGFLLDAEVRAATGGKKSLDDVMRLAYSRFSGEKGFTPEEFRRTAEEVAGIDLGSWYKATIASPGELDYSKALDWYGLTMTKSDGSGGRAAWKLEPRPDATAKQKQHLREWLRSGEK